MPPDNDAALPGPVYMAALLLRGQRCLVVGGGALALEKVEGLLACDASVTLIATDAHPELVQLALEGSIRWEHRDYEPGDLDGCLLAVVAGGEDGLGDRVSADARARGTLVNVVDVPSLCTFILPAIARAGPIAIAISTSGASPALAKRMRDEIAQSYGEPYAMLAVLLNEARAWAKQSLGTYQERKRFFESIVHADPDPIELLRGGDFEAVQQLVRDAQRASAPAAQAGESVDG